MCKSLARTIPTAAVAAAVALSLISTAFAADGGVMAKGNMGGPSSDMHQMMIKDSKEMAAMKPSGDVDRDFAMMMRQHHQGGVRMAEFELKYGKDSKMREMAQKIMASQKKEIAEFDEWMKANPSPKGSK